MIILTLVGWFIPWEKLSYSQGSGSSKDLAPAFERAVTIGAKNGTLSALLLKMTGILLKDQGYTVKELSFSDSGLLRSALEAGVIDLYWESAYQLMEEDRAREFVWLPENKLAHKPVFLMKPSQASEWKIQTISDLAEIIQQNKIKIKFAADKELILNKELVRNLSNGYGLVIPEKDLVLVESHQIYQALNENHMQVAIGWSSDSRIQGYDLLELADDRLLFPSVPITPVIQQEIHDLVPLVSKIVDNLTLEKVLELQYEVDIQGKDVTKVARKFLIESNLLLKRE
ncbi:glycine betaine ABC transporter substrate-binding protein [Ammoniphilus sp. YIM 78166]|uniref:ABC transporter substrate-binding protein n=1 Tax=Ammoniphilus sp. YIM 78166 TaxID=1644106 RepID=UPI0014301418|nr:glycine betaine ABC transporter substrate-binding protein [Ammoniphilus sp. YIM 78166]